MATIVVLDPIAEERPAALELSERPASLAGKRIGFLNNTKANASELLRAIEARLRERYEIATVLHKAKPLAAVGAAVAALDELAASCDVAIVAIGD
jgi:hypothetical protein